jgi:hypothetical protein
MAASYDGDGNRVFQVNRYTFTASTSQSAGSTSPQNGSGSATDSAPALGNTAGVAIGEKRGEKRGVAALIQRMASKGLSIARIAEDTGYSEQEIATMLKG